MAKTADWAKVWRTLFCGWDGDIDFAVLAKELADCRDRTRAAEEQDASMWVCRQIQEAY